MGIMEVVGVRELRQHASRVLRRVQLGESVGITDRGRLVAVLNPPSAGRGVASLMAGGRVIPASRRRPTSLPELVRTESSVEDVLSELREER